MSAFIVCTFFTLISADPESTAKALPPDAVAVMLPPSIVAAFFPPLNEKTALLPELLLLAMAALLAFCKTMAADCSLVIVVLVASNSPPLFITTAREFSPVVITEPLFSTTALIALLEDIASEFWPCVAICVSESAARPKLDKPIDFSP
ncbi:hypothetical protein [Enterobacter quasiroggenkampii]|uniref:hypothetical protein n=1 Tax=Enterobacter quasiroggenkampii TaxID=2497436 RepID=UPI0021CEA5E8|nr:hypothetical protein [Enterobacter quasiroggenkampii]